MPEKELNGTDTDNIGNLEDLPRLEFADGKSENLRVVNDSGIVY